METLEHAAASANNEREFSVKKLMEIPGIAQKTAEALYKISIHSYADLIQYLRQHTAQEVSGALKEHGLNRPPALIDKESWIRQAELLSQAENALRIYSFLLGILSVWRITHLLQAEDGPWDVVVRLRRKAGEGFWGQLLDCFYCLSVWVAAPFAIFLGQKLDERILLWPALSAGAILLERVTDRGHGEAPALFIEESEDEHAMRLWREEGAAPPNNPSEPGA